MQPKNHIAFKEWASVVGALAQGKQVLILRKGGIREESGEFRAEHDEFFLFPTYEHQNKIDLKPEAYHNLETAVQQKPKLNQLPIQYYVKTVSVIHVTEEEDLKQLEPYHIWSDEAIRKRFHYGRQRGLFLLVVRVFRLPVPHLIEVTPEYAGCKSWVELNEKLSTQGALAVLQDLDFQKQLQLINSSLVKL